MLPILKGQSNNFNFKVDIKDSKGEKIIKTFWVFLDEAVIVGYCNVNKAYEYHACKEDPKLGLTTWDVGLHCWRQTNDSVTEKYSEYIAERELLGKVENHETKPEA